MIDTCNNEKSNINVNNVDMAVIYRIVARKLTRKGDKIWTFF